jgi:23S rRNA maturation mini-RNase III
VVCLQTIKLLIDADKTLVLRACGAARETPLHRAVSCCSSVDVVEFVIKNGAVVNAASHFGETSLMLTKDAAVAQLLLKAGADVNARCMRGNTVLHSAAERGVGAGVICCLLKAGADATATDTVSSTPADVALAFGHSATAALLQRAEADQRSKQQQPVAAALPFAMQLSKDSRGWRGSCDNPQRRAILQELSKDEKINSFDDLRRLECALYLTADSLQEYADASTIRSRKDAVISLVKLCDSSIQRQQRLQQQQQQQQEQQQKQQQHQQQQPISSNLDNEANPPPQELVRRGGNSNSSSSTTAIDTNSSTAAAATAAAAIGLAVADSSVNAESYAVHADSATVVTVAASKQSVRRRKRSSIVQVQLIVAMLLMHKRCC